MPSTTPEHGAEGGDHDRLQGDHPAQLAPADPDRPQQADLAGALDDRQRQGVDDAEHGDQQREPEQRVDEQHEAGRSACAARRRRPAGPARVTVGWSARASSRRVLHAGGAGLVVDDEEAVLGRVAGLLERLDRGEEARLEQDAGLEGAGDRPGRGARGDVDLDLVADAEALAARRTSCRAARCRPAPGRRRSPVARVRSSRSRSSGAVAPTPAKPPSYSREARRAAARRRLDAVDAARGRRRCSARTEPWKMLRHDVVAGEGVLGLLVDGGLGRLADDRHRAGERQPDHQRGAPWRRCDAGCAARSARPGCRSSRRAGRTAPARRRGRAAPAPGSSR